MKYCQNCGKQIPDDALFCPSCGKKVFIDPWATAPNVGDSKTTSSNSSSSKTFESEYCQSDNYSKNTSNTGANPTTVNNTSTNTDSYSALSIVGMVFAFLSSLIGLIISICAYNEAKRTGSQKSMGLAKTGIIISSVFIGLAVLLGIIYFIIIVIGVSSLGALAI